MSTLYIHVYKFYKSTLISFKYLKTSASLLQIWLVSITHDYINTPLTFLLPKAYDMVIIAELIPFGEFKVMFHMFGSGMWPIFEF